MNKSTPAKSTTPKPAKVTKPVDTSGKSSAEKRADTIASKRQEKIAKRGYALPLALTCKVTGKEVKYTSPTYIDKVIAKSPGKTLESVRETFVSRDGRRIVKDKELADKKAAKAAADLAKASTEASASGDATGSTTS